MTDPETRNRISELEDLILATEIEIGNLVRPHNEAYWASATSITPYENITPPMPDLREQNTRIEKALDEIDLLDEPDLDTEPGKGSELQLRWLFAKSHRADFEELTTEAVKAGILTHKQRISLLRFQRERDFVDLKAQIRDLRKSRLHFRAQEELGE